MTLPKDCERGWNINLGSVHIRVSFGSRATSVIDDDFFDIRLNLNSLQSNNSLFPLFPLFPMSPLFPPVQIFAL